MLAQATSPVLLAREIVAIGKEMRTRGFVAGTVGNVSARVSADEMLITPTRRDYDLIAPEDLVRVHVADSPPDAASIEAPLHAEIYRARPDVGAVVHTHSPWATARSFDPSPLVVRTQEREYLGLDLVEVVPRDDEVCGALDTRSSVLLTRHGSIGVGTSLREALELCAMVENLAQIDYLQRTFSPGP